MAFKDDLLVLSEAQSLTAISANHPSTNALSLGSGKNAFGAALSRSFEGGRIPWAICKVTTAFTATTADATLTCAFQKSADGSTWSTVFSVTGFTPGLLTKGTYIMRQPVPAGDTDEYIRLLFTIATSAFTVGAVDAWIGYPEESPK